MDGISPPTEAGDELEVAALNPSERRKPLLKSPKAGPPFRLIGDADEKGDPPRSFELLRARRERPCHRAAEQRDEFAAFHCRYLPRFGPKG
jgi:hypothetical protein